MHTYVVTFDGFAANRVVYHDQSVTLEARHDWSLNAEESSNVMFLAHKKIKEHFSRYKITNIEKLK